METEKRRNGKRCATGRLKHSKFIGYDFKVEGKFYHFWFDLKKTRSTPDLEEALRDAAEDAIYRGIRGEYVAGSVECEYKKTTFKGWWEEQK